MSYIRDELYSSLWCVKVVLRCQNVAHNVERGGEFGERQIKRHHSYPSPLNLTKFPSLKDFQYLALVG